MFTVPSLLGTLPPPSLAEADLARFVTRVVSRRKATDLPGIQALLAEEPLTGYPAALGPTLGTLLEAIVEARLPPATIDPEQVDQLLARPETLARLRQRVELVETVLRPGTPVTANVREQIGEARLSTLPGVGPQLALVAPTIVVSIDGLGWSAIRAPALARPMPAAEADALRHAWATLEEHARWPSPEAEPYEAAFVRIAARTNPDAELAAATLRELPEPERRALWDAFLEHLRDQDLPEGHRPGRRGLERRVAACVSLGSEALDAIGSLASAAWEACADDPVVASGRGGCAETDLAAYTAWVDVPETTRERLLALGADRAGHLLRHLAAVDDGSVLLRLEHSLERDLRGLRDVYLAHRYRRDARGVIGVDPLVLAEAHLTRGWDRAAICAAVAELADQARDTPPARATEAPAEASPSANPFAEPAEPADARPPEPAREETARARAAARKRMRTRPVAAPADLPPLPPPPSKLRSRPMTRRQPRTEGLPPLPSPPPRTRREATRNLRKVPTSLQTPPAPPSRPVRSRPKTQPGARHLVTPTQAATFYEAAFRELEILERDLLERGPFSKAIERTRVLDAEASELVTALGPPARSGDSEFQSALRKVELVRSYIVRVRPLLDGSRPLPQDEPDEPELRKPRRFGRLFRRTDFTDED